MLAKDYKIGDEVSWKGGRKRARYGRVCGHSDDGKYVRVLARNNHRYWMWPELLVPTVKLPGLEQGIALVLWPEQAEKLSLLLLLLDEMALSDEETAALSEIQRAHREWEANRG